MCVQQWPEVEALACRNVQKRTSSSWLKDVGLVLFFALWFHTQVLKIPDIKSAHVLLLTSVFGILVIGT